MKILHCNGFRKSEISSYRIILIQNLFLGLKEILSIARDKISKQNIKYLKAIEKFNPYEDTINERIILYVQKLWEDEAVREVVNKSILANSFEYINIVRHIMKTGVNRLLDSSFMPTNNDILHIRQRTAGITETKFKKDRYLWNFIDVGGQRVERKKWIDLNKNLTAIIFVASLIDYNIVSEDDPKKTRMEESLDVWDEILDGRYIRNMPIILFFNKIDLFKKSIKRCSLRKVFKSYDGDDNVENGQRFIMRLYLKRLSRHRNINPNSVRCHFICALDTENIRIVYSDIKDHIIRQRLALSGI